MAVRIWLYVGPWWSLHHKIHCFIPASGLTKLQPFPYTLVDTTLRNGNETMIYFLSHLDRYRWIVMADLVSTRCGMHKRLPPIIVLLFEKLSHPIPQRPCKKPQLFCLSGDTI